MKELFPLNTFQQDAVLKRMNELLDDIKNVDDKMPYDEDTDTYSIDGNLSLDDLSVGGDLSVTGSINGQSDPSVKPIYWHSIRFYKSKEDAISFDFFGVILNNSNTPLVRDDMFELLKVDGFVMLAVSGMVGSTIGQTLTNHVIKLRRLTDNEFYIDFFTNTGGISTVSTTVSNTVFEDLGVNKIN